MTRMQTIRMMMTEDDTSNVKKTRQAGGVTPYNGDAEDGSRETYKKPIKLMRAVQSLRGSKACGVSSTEIN
jgi:hypothetical protein